LATWDGYRHREQRSGKELEQEWQEKNQENSTNQVAMGEVEGAARGTSTRKPYRRALENWQQEAHVTSLARMGRRKIKKIVQIR